MGINPPARVRNRRVPRVGSRSDPSVWEMAVGRALVTPEGRSRCQPSAEAQLDLVARQFVDNVASVRQTGRAGRA
jgi:hypothetical protein